MSDLSLLDTQPYSLAKSERDPLFLTAMKEAVLWHYTHNKEFKALCDSQGFDSKDSYTVEDIPYLPVSFFKKFLLSSVPENEVIRTLYSSSTSGTPSKIILDKTTSDRQVAALNAILSDFLGRERRYFIVLDSEETVKVKNGELTSRGTAIRGMLSQAKNMGFVLDQELHLSQENLQKIKISLPKEIPVCIFGFTWLIYTICRDREHNEELRNIFQAMIPKDSVLLHIGGWKKLKDISVSKEDFNSLVSGFFGIDTSRVIDLYGMTEQLGTVYPDCPEGYKHVPLYSDLLIRDPDTLLVAATGEVGLMQFISPIPHSYPGISLLSEDMGKIVGIDDCRCGRRGKYFAFEKRSEKAELKGCGDTLRV